MKWEVWEFGNESLMRVWLNGGNESKKRKWEKRNASLVEFRVPWQFCIAENDKKLRSRDPLEYKSIISQKPCCNNLWQVVVLEELTWMANSMATHSKRNECSVRFRVSWE